MFASFHSEGTMPSSSDKLNNFASGGLICSTISLSSFGNHGERQKNCIGTVFTFMHDSSIKSQFSLYLIVVVYKLIDHFTLACPNCQRTYCIFNALEYSKSIRQVYALVIVSCCGAETFQLIY